MIELEDLNAFYGKSHILHNVSLTAEENQITTLLGRNGAGKSTTIKSIMGLVTVRSGAITYRGENITHQEIEARSDHKIGYIPEKRRIIPNLTVEENLRLAQLGVDDALDIDEVIDQFSNLQERRNQPGRTLSGGEQQMLAIARALIQDPDLLLVDEPSEGLMPVLSEQVFEFLDEMGESGLTILLTEQQAQKALEISDYAYIIDNGNVVTEGDADSLRQQPEVLENYIGIHQTT
jgi:branched-chain amino acid transport system ATP-binding protein